MRCTWFTYSYQLYCFSIDRTMICEQQIVNFYKTRNIKNYIELWTSLYHTFSNYFIDLYINNNLVYRFLITVMEKSLNLFSVYIDTFQNYRIHYIFQFFRFKIKTKTERNLWQKKAALYLPKATTFLFYFFKQ